MNPTFKILKEVVQTPDGKMFGTMAEASDYWGQQRKAVAYQRLASKLNKSMGITGDKRGPYDTRWPLTANDIARALSGSGFVLADDWNPNTEIDSADWTGR